MNPCCATECDVSLVMGYCPRRSLPARNGPHPSVQSRQPETELEPLVWAQPERVLAWADKAKPGERMVYFTGYLARTPEAGEIAKAAMQLKEAALVVLFQKRTGSDAFDYIAERSRAL